MNHRIVALPQPLVIFGKWQRQKYEKNITGSTKGSWSLLDALEIQGRHEDTMAKVW